MQNTVVPKLQFAFFSEGLRGLLAKDNVGVSVVCPSWVRSPMTKGEEHLPFFMEVEPAVKLIKEELEHNVGAISFPFPTYLVASYAGGASTLWRDVIQTLVTSAQTSITKLG